VAVAEEVAAMAAAAAVAMEVRPIATFVWLHIPSADQTLQQFMANLASSYDAVHPLSTTLQQKSTHTTCVDLVLGGMAAVCVLVHESN